MFTSPWPSLEPYAPMSVPEIIEATVRRLPDKRALITAEGEAHTFAEFWRDVRGMARALQDLGLRKGDMVALYAPNSVEYAVVLHGALLAGATVTTLNPLYREREVEHQLHDSGARFVFTLAPLVPVVDAARAQSDHVERVIPLDEVFRMARAGGEPAPVDIDPLNDIAVLPYSSGTTGLPKGVMLTHQNLTANIRQTMALQMTTEDAVVLDFLPFYHIYGMMVLLNCGLVAGATQVVLPRFEPEAAMALIQQHRVTDLYCVPPVVLALVNQPRLAEFDLSSLRFLMSGAAPLPAEVGRQAAVQLGCVVMQGYGMTEASPITHVNPIASPREGSIGPAVSDTLAKIVSLDSGDELPPGEVGELLVFGPQVMRGYWKNDAATRETLTADGWLRTGDIASADPDGYMRIHDRKKEMIKYKGYQVAPAELEAVLMEHPGVRDAAVIPKADAEAGEVPKAFVVPREPGLDLDEVAAFVAARVAPYKKIREIALIDAVPKNPSGKILRRQLIEEERARTAAAAG
ncbi:MAG: AMP-binding protein [Dehalococcoidia bacterium]|nr:AMP-binding protein [Dehalococcoidia bacterium]